MQLKNTDLTKSLSHEKYHKELKKLQLKLVQLQREIVEKKIPVIVMFEGWDAGGKGGAIKRLTAYLDPRGYNAHGIAAPTPIELAHHYLWRFWNKLPHAGEIAIFDRSWYGRVLVERVEGFAKKKEWQRAYNEINEFEKQLTDSGVVLLKFFLHVSKDEQLKRFKEREKDKLKNWKLTDEDWRNRKKRKAYEEAIDEMLRKTNRKNAPWHVIPGNDKKYARVKVCETVATALKKV